MIRATLTSPAITKNCHRKVYIPSHGIRIQSPRQKCTRSRILFDTSFELFLERNLLFVNDYHQGYQLWFDYNVASEYQSAWQGVWMMYVFFSTTGYITSRPQFYSRRLTMTSAAGAAHIVEQREFISATINSTLMFLYLMGAFPD